MSKLKNIIFDFDGVIADSGDLIYDISKDCDPSLTRDKFIAHSCGNVLQNPKIDYESKGVEYFFNQYSDQLTVEHLSESLEFINMLGGKYNLFIISSNIEGVIKRVLGEAKIVELFGKVLGYESHFSKIEKFKILEKEFGTSNENSIFITDTLGDIKEGNTLGYKTIAATFGIHNRKLLEEAKPYKIVENWEEIISAINKI